MFKDVSELQAFILWAKAQKIVQVKIDKIEVTFSGYAFLDDSVATSQSGTLSEAISSVPKTEEQLKQEELDLLYHSSN